MFETKSNKIFAVFIVIAMLLVSVYYFFYYDNSNNGVKTIALSATQVKGTFTPTQTKVQVTADSLNIRSGAGTNHSIVNVLHKGDTVESLGKIGIWNVIKTQTDTVGAVSSSYLKFLNTTTPTKPVEPTNASTQQKEMLGYINEARAAVGVSPLVLDDKLSKGANLKSKDMADIGYFDHTSPTYGSPFDQMKSEGIVFGYAGENIAKHMTVRSAFDGFMNSPGHRANIENKNYKKLGLGFVQSGGYLYVTQWFTD